MKSTLIQNVLLSTLLLTNLYAQTEDLEKYFNMSIEELLEVEVSGATRTELSLLEVPASVTVFTHKEIKRLGVNSLNELMNYVSGFQSRRSGIDSNLFNTTTRGHLSGFASADILLLVDSQRMTNTFTGGAGSIFSTISLENVEKIEFIRGASSSVYGSNAFSAVINITTLKDANEGSAQVSNHSYQGSALVSVEDGDIKFSGFVKGVKDNGEDYSNLKTNIDSLNPNATASASDDYDIFDTYLQLQYKDINLYISHKQRDTEGFYIVNRLSQDNERNLKNTYIRGTYDLELSSAYQSQIALSFSRYEEDTLVISRVKSFLFPVDEFKGKVDIAVETPSIEWFNTYAINEESSLQFGAEYRRPKVTESELGYNYDIVNPSFPLAYNANYFKFPVLSNTEATDVYGVYGQYQASVFEDFHITLGLRYDDYSNVGSSLNPRAALVYHFLEKTSFKLLYSRAFRAPSNNELYVINSGAIGGNEDLDPETIDNYEAILIQQYKEHSISLSGYVNQIDDIIVEVQGGTNQITRENAGDGTFSGMDIEYVGNWTENFQARLNYSHIFSKPDFAFRASDDITSAILNYNDSAYNLSLSGYYHGSTKNSDDTKVPSYTVVDTKLAYNINENFTVFVRVKNLFDKEYFSPSEGTTLVTSIPTRGRESFAGLDISF